MIDVGLCVGIGGGCSSLIQRMACDRMPRRFAHPTDSVPLQLGRDTAEWHDAEADWI